MIGKIDLSVFDITDELINNNVLNIRNMRTQEELDSSDSIEEYEAIMEERQMFHWVQLGINKEITNKYFEQ
tara:strand:- start:47 stop:259 length:213 start_codon:yes stop_codon:yes gene_type:complete